MLSFAEQIYLLAADEKTGEINGSAEDVVIHNVLVGAVLCELCLKNRLDADKEYIHMIDASETGKPVLDETLDYIHRMGLNKTPIEECLNILSPQGNRMQEKVRDNLVQKNILGHEKKKSLFFKTKESFPINDSSAVQDIKEKLKNIVMSDEIPSPEDTVLASLVNASGLFGRILSEEEIKSRGERIDILSKMDLVGHELIDVIKKEKQF